MCSDTTQKEKDIMILTSLEQTDFLDYIWSSTLEKVGNIGDLQTGWWLISVGIGIALFLALVVTFKTNVNQISRKQLDEFIQVKKYIPELYIELNRNMEYLRYFVHANTWKKRIIDEYNNMFRDTLGKEATAAINNSILTKKLSSNSSYTKIKACIQKRKDVLERETKSTKENREKYGEYYFRLSDYLYTAPRRLELLYELCELAEVRTMVAVGSAGNGKTNNLCKLVEGIIDSKAPCLFINAKKIKVNCYDYVVSQLLPDLLKDYSGVYLHIVSFLCGLQRKKFVIIIDAINENDMDVFVSSIGDLNDKLSKYKHIKVLYACRSEYFEARYNRYFEGSYVKPYVFHLEQVEYSDRAKSTIIRAYMNYFNVSGPISQNVIKRMMQSLFLMRIFFEVNKNKTSQNIELRDAEIYKLYIDSIAQKVSPFDFRGCIEKIASIMVDQCTFDGVEITQLGLSTSDYSAFKDALDDNLIISKSVHIGKGITESVTEYVYFVFDELRDYCLARYVLISSMKKGDETYSDYFKFVRELYEKHQSPIEGILKYGYYYFKTSNNVNLCQSVLTAFADFDPSHFVSNYWMYTRQRVFSNFGVALIFQDSQNILQFERDYIALQIQKEPKLYWDIFWYLFRNEIAEVEPNLNFAVLLLIEDIPFNTTKDVVSYFFNDRYDRFRELRYDSRRRIEILCNRVAQFERRKGVLSLPIKQMLIILAALEPLEPELSKYERFALDQNVIDYIEKVADHEMKKALLELKEKLEKTRAWTNERENAFLLFEVGDL